MSVESIVADEIIARLTPEINAIIGRLDAISVVQIDINQQVRDLRTAIEQAVAECPCDEDPPASPPPVVVVPVPEPPAPGAEPAPAPPSPGPVPVPVPVPVPAGVQFQGSTWTISAEGKVLRDGKPATTPDYTKNVVKLDIEGDDLVQTNQTGERYAFIGSPDWRRVTTPAMPAPTITASGLIALE